MQELKARLSTKKQQIPAQAQDPEQQPKDPPPDLLKKANQFIEETEKALENAIDKDIYQQYFVEKQAATLEQPGVGQAHWIEPAGKLFINLKKIIKKINELKQEPEDKKFATSFDRLEFRARQMDALSQATIELATALHQVKENPILGQLANIKIPYLDSFRKEVEEQKVELEEKEMNKKEHEVKSTIDKTKIAVDLIRNKIIELKALVLKKLKDKPELEQSFDDIAQLATDLKNFRDGLDAAADEKPNLLNLVYNHFSQIQKVLSALPTVLNH